MPLNVINARPADLRLNLVAGDDFAVTFTFVDDADDPIDLSASTWQAYALRNPGDAVATGTAFTVGTGSAATGILTLSLTDTQTLTLPRVGVWYLRDDTNDRTYLAGSYQAAALGGGGTSSTPTNAATVQVTTTSITVTALGVAAGGGGGATNLAYTASPTGGVVSSDTGNDATLTLADGTNAGLMAPAQHTKLAGIEAGATADMTAAEILTAIKTVDGAGSGLDADLLDGNSSAAFATAGHNHTGTYEPAGTVATHEADTTSVHGIADTSALALAADVVAKSLVDAKGDLIVASAADTPARLAVGTNGYVLTADSGETTGVKWAAAAGGGSAPPSHSFGGLIGGTRQFAIPGVAFSGVVGSTTMWKTVYFFSDFVVTDEVDVDALSIEVLNTVASAECRLAIYEADTDWAPTSLVVETAVTACASPGVVTASVSTTTLTAGRYWLSAQAGGPNDGVTVRTVHGNRVGGPIVAGVGAQPFFGVNWASGQTYGAFSSTAPSISNWPYSSSATGHEYFIFPRTVAA